MLVHGHQRPQHARRELLVHDAVGRTVAGEHLVRHQFPRALTKLRAHLLLGAADHERLRLREEVGEQHRVVLAGLVEALDAHEEVGGDDLGALVDQLVEGVLAVGARLAPHDGPGRAFDRGAGEGAALAVALHVALLEVGREAVQVLLVGQHRVRLAAEEVVVPDAQQRQHHGHVGGEGRGAEVVVHGVGAGEQLLEVVHADGQRDGHADRAPERVPPADPVPEAEHVGGVDAEGGHGGLVGRDGDEVRRDGLGVRQPAQQPPARRPGVEHRLLGGEGLGAHQQQRRLRVQALERLRHVRAVNVADEVDLEPRAVVLERLGDHNRTQVRPADADVDDVGEALAREAHALAAPNLIDEDANLGKHRVDLWHNVGTVNEDRGVGAIAERDVEHGPVLSDVDFVAAEHSLDLVLQSRLLSESDEERHGVLGDAILGVVEQDVLELDGEGVEAGRVLLEESPHVELLDLVEVLLEVGPSRRDGALLLHSV
mmetsp:Transcript_41489/g.111062  ORF Transcript_41489/g.111062 Transcript_41489/m.111062 type:complete len:486 (+) Transcript_41489:360-1817(+)